MKKRITAVLLALSMLLSIAACSSDTETGSLSGAIDTLSYEDAERALIKGGMSGYATLSEFWNNSAQNSAGSGRMTLRLTPEQYITDLLQETAGMHVGILNPTVFDVGVFSDGSDMYYGFSYKNGMSEVLSGEFWLDSNTFIMNLPQLFNKYLTTDVSFLGAELAEAMAMLEESTADLPEMPSEQALEAVMNAVFDEYFELIKNAPVRENTEITINNRAVTANKVEIELTEETMTLLAIALLESVSVCNEIKGFIQEIHDMSSPFTHFNVDAEISDALREGRKALAELDDNEVFGTMTAYIRGGDIVMREFIIDDVTISLAIIDDYSEFVMKDDNNVIRVIESGENVTVDIETDDERVTLEMRLRDDSFVGSLSIGGVKAATAELIWEDDFAGKPVPALNATNSVDMDNINESDAMVIMENATKIATGMESGGYDIIGLMIMMPLMMMNQQPSHPNFDFNIDDYILDDDYFIF
jgi:hypothetical protein